MSFGKIFESTYTGSMVGSGPVVFAVWGYIIANTRPPGVVEINPIILGAMLGATAESVQNALDFLQAEDARSRSKECDGRRLVKIGEFIYSVPTWQRYREARNDDERKEYMRDYMRDYRLKIKETGTVKQCVNTGKPQLAKAEAEAEAEELETLTRSNSLPSAASAAGSFDLEPKIQALKPGWRVALNKAEQDAMDANARSLDSLTDADWHNLREYLHAKIPQGVPGFQPRSRLLFIQSAPDVVSYATEWARKNKPKRGWSEPEPIKEFVPISREQFKAMTEVEP